MITLDRLQRIFLLSLPIIGGMISQNILNIVDTAMVGHLGATALAAVGTGGGKGGASGGGSCCGTVQIL